MSGLIPPEFIDELLARTDIVDIIDSRVPLKKTGRDYQARCPFHDERTPSFTVSQTKQFYHCFGCGAHGSAIGFLMNYEHMEFREAVEQLASRAGLKIPASHDDRKVPVERAADLEAALACAQRHFEQQLRRQPQADAAVAYLKRRGLTGEIALRFGLGYAPEGWDHLVNACGADDARAKALVQAGLAVKKEETGRLYDRFRNRITFPIHDHRGRLVGFGGRAIGNDEPKYLNTPETPLFHKGAELYHLYAARGTIRDAGRALVVEGYMDVVALVQYGIENVVATLGTATTKTHLDRLFRHCPEVVFCFDGDRAGRAAAWRALEVGLSALRDGRQIGFLFLPEGDDPDSLVRAEGTEAFRRRMATAVPLPDFLFQHLTEQVDLARMDGRARLASLAKPLLAKIETGVLRELLMERLARLCELPRESLEKQLRVVPATPAQSPPAKPPAAAHDAERGALRTALALVLQQPQLARIVGDLADLHALHRVGAEVLAELVEVVRHHPGLSTGALLERFRDRDYLPRLEKLAAWDHLIPEDKVEDEFRAAIRRLHHAAREHEAQELLAESRGRELSAAEKDRLKRLLHREDTRKGT